MSNIPNLTNNITYLFISEEDLVDYIIKLAVSIIMAHLATILNSVLILIWLIHPSKINYSDFLYFSMAISDFIYGFVICPIESFDYSNKLRLKIIELQFIKITSAIDNAITSTSLMSLLLLSLHRYRQLNAPLKEKSEINKTRAYLIFSIWFICLVYWISLFFFSLNFLINSLIFYLSHLFFLYVPLFLITISNILILRKFTLKIQNSKIRKTKFNKERKAIKCIIYISAQLISLSTFYLIYYTIYTFKSDVNNYIKWFANIANFYPATNPVIVFSFHSKYRKRISKIYQNLRYPKNPRNLDKK